MVATAKKSPRRKSRRIGIAETLRRCVKQELRGGISVLRLANTAGVPQPSLARWISSDTKTARESISLETAEKLAKLGSVDVLCTHVPPEIPALATDVIGGREKGSQAILDYVETHEPPFHYFGDIHQPRATTWRIGSTVTRNLGYFRATGRATRHG